MTIKNRDSTISAQDLPWHSILDRAWPLFKSVDLWLTAPCARVYGYEKEGTGNTSDQHKSLSPTNKFSWLNHLSGKKATCGLQSAQQEAEKAACLKTSSFQTFKVCKESSRVVVYRISLLLRCTEERTGQSEGPVQRTPLLTRMAEQSENTVRTSL